MNTFSKLIVAAGLALCTGIVAAKSGAPVKLEFRQKDTIQAGAPVEITVTLIAASSVQGATVQFRGSDGLTLLSGQQLSLDSSTAGERVDHRIKLSAPANGRYHLTAVIQATTQGNELARTVAVPVVIGDPAKISKPSSAAPKTDATGERIKSLPATEPK